MVINKEINSGYVDALSVYNPIKDTWIARWGAHEDDGNLYHYETIFTGKPDVEEIKKVITEHLNTLCNEEIFKGFLFENNVVWLSQENQQNYLRDLNLAKISEGENLPIRYKFGDDVYKDFTSINDLQNFNIQVANHINNTIQKYWELKDNIDWSLYK